MTAKKIPSSGHKAARVLTHYLTLHLVPAYGAEYLICYGVTLIANGTLFHGRLDSPVAAIGVMAAGSLARYFLKPQPVKQQQPYLMSMPTLSPAELTEFGKALGLALDDQDGASGEAGPYPHAGGKPTPYL